MSINKTKRKKENEKGSITLFVLMAILFFTIVVFSVFTNGKKSNTAQIKQIEKIQSEYDVTDEELDKVYEEKVETIE